jgi:transcriptional regulator with XRE-family HTH domain
VDILRTCVVAHKVRHMTSAYESGQVPPIEVRHRLRISREFAGLEQEELADQIGVSRTTIGNAETGRVKPRKITLNAWAYACGVPVSWIESGGEAPPPSHVAGGRGGDPDGAPSKRRRGNNYSVGCGNPGYQPARAA